MARYSAFLTIDLEKIKCYLRNVDEIISPTMHHSFRPPLPDLKSQKYQNSPLFHQLLYAPTCGSYFVHVPNLNFN